MLRLPRSTGAALLRCWRCLGIGVEGCSTTLPRSGACPARRTVRPARTTGPCLQLCIGCPSATWPAGMGPAFCAAELPARAARGQAPTWASSCPGSKRSEHRGSLRTRSQGGRPLSAAVHGLRQSQQPASSLHPEQSACQLSVVPLPGLLFASRASRHQGSHGEPLGAKPCSESCALCSPAERLTVPAVCSYRCRTGWTRRLGAVPGGAWPPWSPSLWAPLASGVSPESAPLWTCMPSRSGCRSGPECGQVRHAAVAGAGWPGGSVLSRRHVLSQVERDMHWRAEGLRAGRHDPAQFKHGPCCSQPAQRAMS